MTMDYTAYWRDLTVSHANHPGNLFRYDLIVREIQKLSPARQRLIDCGCGDGSLLEAITQQIACQEAYGIDVAANAPASRPGMPFRFQQHNLASPVPESLHSHFDLVICSEVIEHVDEDDGVLQNLAALAAPEGIVIITTQSGNIYKTESYLGHLRHYQLDDLTDRLEQHGLRVQLAYRCGWPWLNLQKIAAHIFQGTVQRQIVHATELSLKVKVLFGVLRQIYRFSSKSKGPQIIIVAKKM